MFAHVTVNVVLVEPPFPSFAVTVIVAVPIDLPVIVKVFPETLTVATPVLLDDAV